MKIIDGIVIGGIGLISGAIVGAIGLLERKRGVQLESKVNQAVESVAERSIIDIDQSIVDRGVQVAIERASEKMVRTAIQEAKDDASYEIKKKIHDAVDAEFERQKEHFSGRLASEIDDKFDDAAMEAIKKSVIEKVEQSVLKKFYELGGIPKVYGAFSGVLDHMHGTVSSNALSILNQFTYASDKLEALRQLVNNGYEFTRSEIDKILAQFAYSSDKKKALAMLTDDNPYYLYN